ncbi:RHS repeat-associated core domain-containing protein [Brevibacillus fluminis]|uniref:RHS repeat domain-containing protein n=1 Tax=Brevibacillus fluminis TaxID=511487 RepID=UPI003F8B4738
MIRKIVTVYLLISLVVTSMFAGESATELDMPYEQQSSDESGSAETVEWMTDELAGAQDEERDPSLRPDLSDEQIRELTWDQLPVEDVIDMNSAFERTTLQICAYFYSNLQRLLSQDEIVELLNWSDADVMNEIAGLSPEQFGYLEQYAPLISTTYKKWTGEIDEEEGAGEDVPPVTDQPGDVEGNNGTTPQPDQPGDAEGDNGTAPPPDQPGNAEGDNGTTPPPDQTGGGGTGDVTPPPAPAQPTAAGTGDVPPPAPDQPTDPGTGDVPPPAPDQPTDPGAGSVTPPAPDQPADPGTGGVTPPAPAQPTDPGTGGVKPPAPDQPTDPGTGGVTPPAPDQPTDPGTGDVPPPAPDQPTDPGTGDVTPPTPAQPADPGTGGVTPPAPDQPNPGTGETPPPGTDDGVNGASTPPADIKYTQSDQKLHYFRGNTAKPVDDMYRAANVVERDIVLEGKHGMDFVLQRRYHSMNSKITEPGYNDSVGNKAFNARRDQYAPFANGWDFNLPKYERVTHQVTVERSRPGYYQEKDELLSTYDSRYFIELDDGTNLEWSPIDQYSLGWVNYPYQGISFTASRYGDRIRLKKDGYLYEFEQRTEEPSGLIVTKTNPFGDRIVYKLPDSSSDPIEITDSIGRKILLEKTSGFITDAKVMVNGTIVKHVRYGLTMGTNNNYAMLSDVTQVSHQSGQADQVVAQYEYHDPNVIGKAEFNLEKHYEISEALNYGGIESQDYVDQDRAKRATLSYLLLRKVTYPLQGLSLAYSYSAYNAAAENPLNRGVVRLYQDDHALSYVSYNPVTTVNYMYSPKADPLNKGTSERLFTKSYEMISKEFWKVPKAKIPRLAGAADRNGQRVVSKESSALAPTIERTYEGNDQGNYVLILVKTEAKEAGNTQLAAGSKQYHYNPVTYVSNMYQGNDTQPSYQYTFLDPASAPAGVSLNQSVYDYLLHKTSQRPTSAELKKYANETVLAYNVYGDQIQAIDPKNNVTNWEYESVAAGEYRKLMRLKKQAANNSSHYHEELYTYNADQLLETETITDSYPGMRYQDQLVRTYAYENKLVSAVTETSKGAEAKTLTRQYPSYDAWGLYPTSMRMNVQLANGQVSQLQFSYDYDGVGNLLSRTYPDGSRAEYEYDILDRETKETFISSDNQRRETRYTYLDNARKIIKTLPDQSRLETTYTPYGEIELQQQVGTDGSSRPLVWNEYAADAMHLLAVYPYALANRKTSYSYYEDGAVSAATDPIGTTTYARVNASYSADTYLPETATREKAPNGRELTTIMDRYGQNERNVDKTGDALQTLTTTYSRDAFGHVTQKTMQNAAGDSRVWSYLYDLRGKPLTITDPEANVYNYDYDSLGNLVTVTENGTVTSSYHYNELSWLLSETNTGSSLKKEYTYKNSGDVATYKDKQGNTYRYQYTPFYEVDSLTITNPSQVNVYQENYTYDPTSRKLVSQSNSDGTSISYSYDAFQRMKQFTQWNRTYTLGYTDGDDLLDTLNYNNSAIVNYTYDNAGRMQTVTSSLFAGTATYAYTTGPTGATTTVTYPGGTRKTTTNSFGEVTETIHNDGWRETDTYDGFGNQASQTRNSVTTQYNYDKVDRLKKETLASEEKTYSYDQLGNRKTWKSTQLPASTAGTYKYDALNRLKSYTPTGTTTPSVEFTYNNDGLRATKKANGEETRYVYLNGKVIEELNANGVVKATNVWGNELLFRNDASSGKGGFYSYNSHGDVVKVTSPAGAVLNSYDYDSWGNVLTQTEGMNNPFKYAGEMYDAETRFYYLRARYYDPSVGRFITEDTYKGQVDNPLSLNRYTYVHNNPLKFIDPSGYEAIIGGDGATGTYYYYDKAGVRRIHGTQQIDYEFYDDQYYAKGIDAIPNAAGLHDLYRGNIRELEGFEDPTIYISGAAGILRGMVRNVAVKGSKTVGLLFLSLFAAGGKKEGIEVSEQLIKNVMKDAPLKTQQGAVSLPAVQRYVQRLLNGEAPPPIKVSNGIIVDGNHRYIASRIVGKDIEQVQWSGGRLDQVIDWIKVKIDPTDWGNK